MTMRPYNFRLDDETNRLIDALAQRVAGSRASVVRRAVRDLAIREGIAEPAKGRKAKK